MSYRNNPAWLKARQQLINGHPSGDSIKTLAFRMKAIHRLYEIEVQAAELGAAA